MKIQRKALESYDLEKGHLRGVGTGLELVRESLGRNPSRVSCESKGWRLVFWIEWKMWN